MKKFISIACLTFVVLLFNFGYASAQSGNSTAVPRGGYCWRAMQAGAAQNGTTWQCPRGFNCPGPGARMGMGGGRGGWGRGAGGNAPGWRGAGGQ